jgi:hypothetical protein
MSSAMMWIGAKILVLRRVAATVADHHSSSDGGRIALIRIGGRRAAVPPIGITCTPS